MPATLAELLTPVTVTEAESTILGILEAVGFPATAWGRFGFARTMVKLVATLFSDVKTGITNIVKSRLLDLSEGDALTYLAANGYEIERDAATATEGEFLLTDAGGAPYTIAVGDLLVREVITGNLYRNITAGTLSSGGTLTLTFRAESPGADYNIATSSTLEFAETLEGVDITNPAISGSDTWITSTGTDEQSDESLREECRAQWATVGAGTKDAYGAWAREGASSLTKVTVYDDEPYGAGSVLIVLATDAGAPSAGEVAAADAVIQAKRPLGLSVVNVVGAAAQPVTISAEVNVYSGESSYLTSLASELVSFQAEHNPGDTVYLSRVNALLHEPGNVRNVTITSPSTNVGVDFDAIAVFSLGTITVNTVS